MKILVVHEVSYENKVVYEIHEFPELLALNGHEITFFEFDEGLTFAQRSKSRDRVVSGRVHASAQIRVISPHRFGLPRIDRLWAVLSSIPLLYKLLRIGGYDVVINYAVPTYGLQVNLLCKLLSVPVVQRAIDVSSQIRKLAFIGPIVSWFEKLCFELATVVSTNNPAMTQYVLDVIGPKNQLKVIQHFPPLDKQVFHPIPKNRELAKELGLDSGDRVIVYMGSFFYFSGLDDVLNEFAKLMADRLSVKLLLIGGGEQDQMLREIVSKLGLETQVVFTGVVPFHALPSYLSIADVAISPLKGVRAANAAFPQKVLQYMSMGLPTVSTKLEGLYATFGDFAGLTWSKNPQETLVMATKLLNQSEIRRRQQIKLQSEYLNKMFSPIVTVSRLEQTLMEVRALRR